MESRPRTREELTSKGLDTPVGVAYFGAASGVRKDHGATTMKKLASVLVMLAVVGVGRADDEKVRRSLGEKGIEVWTLATVGNVEDYGISVRFAAHHGDPSLTELCELRRLQWLDLSGSRVTDAGMGTVGGLNGLRTLELNSTRVTAAGDACLVGLLGLRELHLENCPGVTDASIMTFARMKGLRLLNLTSTGVTKEGVTRLQEVLPDCKVVSGKR
jgi:hypothetical protein